MKKSRFWMAIMGVFMLNSWVQGAYYDQPLTVTTETLALYQFDGSFMNATGGAYFIPNEGDYSFEENNPNGNSAFGTSLYFDWTNNNRVVFTAIDGEMSATQFLQIDLWICPYMDSSSSSDRVIIAKNLAYCICIMPSTGNHANQIRVLLGTGKDWDFNSAVYSTTAMTDCDRTWTHISVQYGGGQVQLLINGVVEGTVNWSGTIAGGNNLILGGWSSSDRSNYEGLIDELRVSTNKTDAPVFTPAGPIISGTTTVAISCATDGASIYYTTNGDTPTTSSTQYTNPVEVTPGTTLKAIAVADGYPESAMTSQSYRIQAYYDQPLTEVAGTRDLYHFDGDLTNATGGVALVSNGGDYSFEENNPNGNSAFGTSLYFDWTNNNRVVFTAIDGEMSAAQYLQIDLWICPYMDSSTSSDRVIVSKNLAYCICIMPSTGGHANQIRVLLGTGKDWDFNSVVYSTTAMTDCNRTWTHISVQYSNGQVQLLINGVVEGTVNWSGTIAGGNNLTLGGWSSSDRSNYEGLIDDLRIVSMTVAAPVFTPVGPYITGPTDVTITSETDGVSIYYTVNGEAPTARSTKYTNPVEITPGTTLKAIAVSDNYGSSTVTSQTYTTPKYNRPEVISAGTATVDGDLSDWSGATWAPLDKTYNITNSSEAALNADIAEAYYSAKWQAHKLYVAVKVKDMAHSFEDTNTAWNGQDAVEIYLHTDGGNPTSYANCTSAQQYVIGIKKSDHTKAWANIGGAGTTYAIPEDGSFDAVGKVAVHVDGDWLYYEVEITPFTYFSFIVDGNMTNSVVTNLSAGDIIGLDVCVDGHNATAYSGMKSENTQSPKYNDWTQLGLHKLVSQTGSTAIIDRVADGTYSATGSSSPALTYGNPISTVNWISAGVGGKTFNLTNPKYNVVVTGTVTGLTGESVGGSGGWMSLGLVNKHYLDGLAIGQDPGVTYASGQYGFGVNGGISIVGSDVNHSANDAVVNIHDGWPEQTSDTHLGTNAFDFKVVYNFLDGDTRDERSIRAYWKPAGSDGWICLGTQYTMGYPLNATFTSGRSDYYLADQWNESQVGVMVTHDAAGQTASISIANMKLAYENVLAGDANFDNLVDVGDLGILAANYGKTSGATWDLGDFNGDGAVDVGDLGILAANYGKNASGADFEADYAKVFGTDSTSTETTDDSSTICSSLGLSLITGLALMGLLIVKLEE